MPVLNLWNHPRTRKEYILGLIIVALNGGLPSRMRGAQRSLYRCAYGFGITPAYAGSTATACGSAGRRQDHPRVCGEHRTATDGSSSLRGSPPRMRGARAPDGGSDASLRITPAYAGSTVATFTIEQNPKDHPRVCGEHFAETHISIRWLGSPPRMRGAQRR